MEQIISRLFAFPSTLIAGILSFSVSWTNEWMDEWMNGRISESVWLGQSNSNQYWINHCNFAGHYYNRIRRIYFSDRLYSEDELPGEFKLYLPVPAQKTKPSTSNQQLSSPSLAHSPNNSNNQSNNGYTNGYLSSTSPASQQQQQYQKQSNNNDDEPAETIVEEGQSEGPEQEPEDRDDKAGDEWPSQRSHHPIESKQWMAMMNDQ